MTNNQTSVSAQAPMRPAREEIAKWREAMIAKILMWPGLSERAVRVGIAIVNSFSHSKDEGRAYPGKTKNSIFAGLHYRTILRAKHDLARAGLFKFTPQFNEGRNSADICEALITREEMKAILALKTSSAPTSDHKKLMEMMFANAREDSREANETVTPTAPGVGTKLCPWGEDRVVPREGGPAENTSACNRSGNASYYQINQRHQKKTDGSQHSLAVLDSDRREFLIQQCFTLTRRHLGEDKIDAVAKRLQDNDPTDILKIVQQAIYGEENLDELFYENFDLPF